MKAKEFMADLSSYYQDPNLESSRLEAQAAQKQASTYQSASALLPERLKQAINEKLNYNKDIIEQQNKAMAEYFQAPSEAREKYQDVFNPFQREKLVSQERTQAYAPYATLSDILAERKGSIADLINAGTGAFSADVMAKQSAADLSRQSYQDRLTMAELLASAAEKEAALAKGGSGGGLGLDLSSLLGLDLGLGGQEEELTPPPFPSGLPGSSYYKAPDMEWPQGSGVYWIADGKGGWM